MAYQFWSAAEDAKLPMLVAQGLSAEEIGEKLNRTPRAVRKRAETRGLTFTKAKLHKSNGAGSEIEWLSRQRSS